MIDITVILQIIIVIICAVISAVLIPWINSKKDSLNMDELAKWVRIAVQAAEQLFVGSGRGAEKREYVVKFLQEHGFTADMAVLETLLESSVLNLNRQLDAAIPITAAIEFTSEDDETKTTEPKKHFSSYKGGTTNE